MEDESNHELVALSDQPVKAIRLKRALKSGCESGSGSGSGVSGSSGSGSCKEHPIRTLYPNKIIVSNKLLGLLGLGSVLEFGSGLIYMHEMTIPVTIGIIKHCNQ